MLDFEIIRGILLPFAGTTLGAACVFFMKKDLHEGVQRVLTLSLSEEEQKRFAESCQLLRENYKGILDDNS